MKKALVVRLGAFGDAVMITPLIRELHNDDYRVTVNASEDGMKVLRWNPFISEFILKKRSEKVDIDEYWKKISEGYDKFINLSGSIEEKLLKPENSPKAEFYWSKSKRHDECNINYYDHTLSLGGYPDVKGKNGELYFTKKEHRDAKKILQKLKGKFVVLWSLSGSSFHKAYPYAEYVACEFLERHPDAVIITVGNDVCKLLEWDHPRTLCKSGDWDMRTSMIMTKYADLVVGTETGVLNASSCFDTPKVVLLSHSSHENLTKYWENVHPIHADVPCYPCHQLHYTRESCPLGDTGDPLCIDIKPNVVLETIEDIYWRKRNEKSISNLAVAV